MQGLGSWQCGAELSTVCTGTRPIDLLISCRSRAFLAIHVADYWSCFAWGMARCRGKTHKERMPMRCEEGGFVTLTEWESCRNGGRAELQRFSKWGVVAVGTEFRGLGAGCPFS